MHRTQTSVRRLAALPALATLAAVALAAPEALAQEPEALRAEIPPEKLIPQQEPDKRLSSELIGNPVLNREGVSIGTLDSLLFDAENRVIGAVVASGGIFGIGTKRVGLSWDAFELEERATGQVSVYADLSQEQIAQAPEFRDRATLRAEQMMQRNGVD